MESRADQSDRFHNGQRVSWQANAAFCMNGSCDRPRRINPDCRQTTGLVALGQVPYEKEWAHPDGGHEDNLGLALLLAREVKNILAFVNTAVPMDKPAVKDTDELSDMQKCREALHPAEQAKPGSGPVVAINCRSFDAPERHIRGANPQTHPSQACFAYPAGRWVKTDSDHKFNIAPNLLDRNFTAEGPNQK